MINFVNLCGEYGFAFAADMLIQSSILIAVLLALDWAIKSRARAVFRYSLGLLVLVKLVLPPSFAAPTGVGYWLAKENPSAPIVTTAPITSTPHFTPTTTTPTEAIPLATPSVIIHAPALTLKGKVFILWLAGVTILTLWLTHRSRLISKMVQTASDAPPFLNDLLQDCSTQLGIKCQPKIKICQSAQSPALCGIFHPTILIPERLAKQLTEPQMKAVLLHELVHFKRHDLHVNFVQALLQVAYWWHPLLWLANSRLQHLREEAVDETVMVRMQKEADIYPETLLTVAKAAFTRPLLTLGMVGIIESKSALKNRIRRVIEMEIPKSEKLHASRVVLLLALAACLLPMAQAAPKLITQGESPKDDNQSKASVQFQTEVAYVYLRDGNFVKMDLETRPDNQTNWIREQNKQFIKICSPKYTTAEGDQIHIEVPNGPQLDVIPKLTADRYLYLEHGPIAKHTAFITVKVTSHANADDPVIAAGIPYLTVKASTGHNDATFHVAEFFNAMSGATYAIALETNIPCRQFVLLKTTIIKGAEDRLENAKAVTVLQPFCQQNPTNSFPVITRSLVEKTAAMSDNNFTLETTLKILLGLSYEPGKTIGFDQTFLDHFQDKGATLFMAGAMVMAGNGNHVTGVIELMSSKSKARSRTFHVDFNLFRENVMARRDKNLSPESSSWIDILKVLFEEAGLDCETGNKIRFDETKGAITISDSQNSDAVERIILDLNQPNDSKKVWLPFFSNHRDLLTEAMFVELTDVAFENLQLKPERRTAHQIGDYYLLDSKSYAKTQDYLSNNGQVFSRPRMQSVPGVSCSLFSGNATNSVELKVVDYMFDKKMKTTILGRTTGTFSRKTPDWPDALGQTNVAIYANIPNSTSGGVLFRVRNSTTNPTNTLALLLKISVTK